MVGIKNILGGDAEDENSRSQDVSVDAILDRFCDSNFDPELYAFAYHKNHCQNEARDHCVNILEHKNAATHQLQRKIYKHYPNFIESAHDISQARNDLATLRTSIHQLDTNLSKLQATAQTLTLITYNLVRLNSNSNSGSTSGVSNKIYSNITPVVKAKSQSVVGEQDIDFATALADESRFNSVVALSGNDIRWILEAPDNVDVLVYERRYKEAVDLIVRLRNENLENLNLNANWNQIHKSRSNQTDQHWALNRAKEKVNTRAKEVVKVLISALLDGRTLNVPISTSATAVSDKDKNLDYSDHPVSLLQQLGEEQAGSDAFFEGQRKLIRRACHSVMASSLASDPEQCVLELSQRVFRGILDTVSVFGHLFLKQCRRENGQTENQNQPVTNNDDGGTNTNKTDNEKEVNKNGMNLHNPRLIVWASEVIQEYCSHFTRFALPEFRQDAERFLIDAKLRDIEVIQVDTTTAIGTAIKFASEKVKQTDNGNGKVAPRSVSGLLVLSQDEWTILGECLRYTMLLCRRLEKEHLSLGYCVARELHEPLTAAVYGAFRNLEASLRVELLKESWNVTQLKVEGSHKDKAGDKEKDEDKQLLSLTSSGFKFYDLMHELMRNLKKKVLSPNYTTTPALQKIVVASTHTAILKYVENIVHAAGAWPMANGSKLNSIEFEDGVYSLVQRGSDCEKCFSQLEDTAYMDRPLTELEKRIVAVIVLNPWTDSQQLAQIADIHYVSADLLPRVKKNLEKVFKRQVPMLSPKQNDFSGYLTLICEAYSRRRANALLEDILRWSQFDYSVPVKGHISENFVRVAEHLLDLKNKAQRIFGKEITATIIVTIVENMLFKLSARSRKDDSDKVNANIRALFGNISNERGKNQLQKDIEYLRDQSRNLFGRPPSEAAEAAVTDIAHAINN